MLTLIIAPHCDDELIGCWSVISNGSKRETTVHFIHELSDRRKKEALGAAAMFGFTPVFGHHPALDHSKSGYDEVYVPSRRDWHADHQSVNKMYRHWATHFYSVDMGRGKLLPLSLHWHKLEALNICYPSQRALWHSNDKYWLFEDIQANDYDVYRKLVWTNSDGSNLTIKVLAEYAQWVEHQWYNHLMLNGYEVPDADVDRLLAHCSGKVTIEYKNQIIEA